MRSRFSLLSILLLAGVTPVMDAAQATPVPSVKMAPALEKGVAEYWKAITLMQNGNPSEHKAARKLLQAAADADYAPALLQLGGCYQNGSIGFSANPKKAFAQFRKAAGLGNGYAMVNLGLCYLEGKGCKKDLDLAREQFQTAVGAKASYERPTPPESFQGTSFRAPTNSSLASAVPAADPGDQARGLAYACLGDIATTQGKPAEAQAFYLKGCELGGASNFGAVVKAAVNYATGSGCDRDQGRAEALFAQARRMSRRLGAAFAHNLVEAKVLEDFVQGELEEELKTKGDQELVRLYVQVADVLADEKNPKKDFPAAASWLRLAFDAGDAWSGLRLAFTHLDGKWGPVDDKAAFAILEKLQQGRLLYIAVANYAICLERGLGTPADHARAAALFAKYRNDDYLCHLGADGRCPERPLDYSQALELHRKAAQEGRDSHAQFLWGRRLEQGWGITQNLTEAAKWYELAAKQGSASALCSLGLLHENHKELFHHARQEDANREAAALYLRSAEAGNPFAMNNLANCYMDGLGVSLDEDAAESWYSRCLAQLPDHYSSHNNFAVLLQRQYERALAKKDNTEAAALKERFLLHYRIGAEGGNPYAQRNYGDCFADGLLPDPDHRLAYTWYDKAANQDDVQAHLKLGIMLEDGVGVPVTYPEAAYHYRIAALGGNLEALRRLCNLCLEGKGVSQDTRRASYWLGQLATRTRELAPLIALSDLMLKNGDQEEARLVLEGLTQEGQIVNLWSSVARYRLAQIHERGLGVKVDAKRAQALRVAAFAGRDAEEAYNLAMVMRKKRLLPGAFDLLEMSFDMGFKPARCTLAWALITGEFTFRDTERGWTLMQGLVRDGDLEALTWSAYGTLQGVEGAPGLQEAIDCASKASERGDKRATQILAMLRKRAGA